MIPLGQIQTTSKTNRLRPLSFFIAVALGLFHDPCWWVIQVQKPCHFVAMAFIVLNTRLNLRFRLVQNIKSQHVVLAFEPAEREGLSSLRSDIEGLHIKKQMPGLRPLSFFIAVALESKLSTLHQRKMPRKGAFVFSCGERGIRTPGPVTVNGFQDRRIRPLCHLSGAKVKHRSRIIKKSSKKHLKTPHCSLITLSADEGTQTTQ